MKRKRKIMMRQAENYTSFFYWERIKNKQFYYYMMSKFHKTTYSRPQSFQISSSSHSRRNPASNQHPEYINNHKDNLIHGKIQIQSSLLISHKNYKRQPSRPIESQMTKKSIKNEEHNYQHNQHSCQAKERPMSKQELRNRGENDEVGKTNNIHQRPRTSKGPRNCRANQNQRMTHKKSQPDDQFEFPVKLNYKNAKNVQSSSFQRGNKSSILALQTSIDPEFLSLFAN